MEVDPRPNSEAEMEPRGTGASADAARRAEAVVPRCPNCGWQDVRASRSRSALGVALALFSIAPFRCRSCSHRFYRFHKKAREL